ncbi:hypothetical protein evm_005517 [Chilo suppressalis]|nr:hypothetical protein evm_005517 [Chilo suppressalis]
MISNRYHEKYSNYHYCIVRECKNTSLKTPGKLWIKVPKEFNLRNTWLELAKIAVVTRNKKHAVITSGKLDATLFYQQ